MVDLQLAALHHRHGRFDLLDHLARAVGKHFPDEAVIAHKHTLTGSQCSPIGFGKCDRSQFRDSPLQFADFFFAQHDSRLRNPASQINRILPVSNSCIMASHLSSTTRVLISASVSWPCSSAISSNCCWRAATRASNASISAGAAA